MKSTALFASLLLTACASSDPPAVRAPIDANIRSESPPAAGMTRVIFVRPDAACDNGTYPTIIDENGHFVAQMGENSQVTVDIASGDHTLIAFSNVDLRNDPSDPDDDPIGVARFEFVPDRTNYVHVFVPQRQTIRCYRYTMFAMRPLKPDDSDLQTWLANTRKVVDDRAAGEAALIPADVHAHLETAARAIARRKTEHRAEKNSSAINSADTK